MNDILTEALMYIGGIVVYSVFIFKFYRFLATRDLIKLHIDETMSEKQKITRRIGYALENIIITPFLVFFWMLVLSALIMLLTHHTAVTVLLLSTALVGAVRVCAYLSENLAQDLAKMVPFGLLAVFITDVNFNLAFPELTGDIFVVALFYLGLIVAIELVLRVIHGIFTHKQQVEEEEKIKEEQVLHG